MSDEEGKVVDASAQWDDQDGIFRVHLIREKDGTRDDGTPMEAVIVDGGETECRLYQAVFCANPRDFMDKAHTRDLGFEKRAPAERAAKAVKRELQRIEKGEPGPDAMTIQVAIMLAGRSRR